MKLLVPAVTSVALLGAPAAMAADWTGPYAGFSIGHADVDGPGAADGKETTFGGHIGYDYDFGDFVVGSELEVTRFDLGLPAGGGTVDNVANLKLKGGYDFGPALGYAVVGASRAYTSLGNENGYVYGLGVAYQVTEQFTVSGEVLQHKFSNVSSSTSDLDSASVNLRASFRF
ncbi:outer membrane protein [Tropicibacter sp. Alg240-R139]|uniref:outer membrane protein n=1 Tax=Tropicibacter sp. Alg240-R139 TaxID=2305991 RepID=UPI0013DF5299|nr:outer membrane beta-barrel protein [Tropicibacter sp. Alg240-R139]